MTHPLICILSIVKCRWYNWLTHLLSIQSVLWIIWLLIIMSLIGEGTVDLSTSVPYVTRDIRQHWPDFDETWVNETSCGHLQNNSDWPDGGAITRYRKCKRWKVMPLTHLKAWNSVANISPSPQSSQGLPLARGPTRSAIMGFSPFWIHETVQTKLKICITNPR